MNHRKEMVMHSGEEFRVVIEDLTRQTAVEMAREIRADYYKARVIRRSENRCYAIGIRHDRIRDPQPRHLGSVRVRRRWES